MTAFKHLDDFTQYEYIKYIHIHMPHDVNNTLAKLISIVLESYKAYGLYNSLSTTQNNILSIPKQGFGSVKFDLADSDHQSQ